MEKTLVSVQGDLQARTETLETLYNEILERVGARSVDSLIASYGKEVAGLDGGLLSNERVAYYQQNLGYHAYRLATAYSRQSLSSFISKTYVEVEESKLFLSAQTEETGKLTRDDKRAIAIVQTEHERDLAVVLKRAEHSIEQRLNEVHSLMDVLKTIGMINMSEAKKTGGNF